MLRVLAMAAVLLGGAPAHRRFMQPNLSRGPSCSPAAGSAFPGNTWTEISDVGAITVTLNAGDSPACTTNATRLQIPAASEAHYAVLRSPSAACPTDNAAHVIACWVRGRSATGNVDMGVSPADGYYHFERKAFTTSWQLLSITADVTAQGGTTGRTMIGSGGLLYAVDLVPGTPVANGALDIEVFGCSCT